MRDNEIENKIDACFLFWGEQKYARFIVIFQQMYYFFYKKLTFCCTELA